MRTLVLLAATTACAYSQRGGPPPKVEPLYASLSDADAPTISIYAAPGRRVPTAVVVCPGGGYRNLAIDHEGEQVARWLNSLGITAVVLKYRLGPKYHHPTQLGDVLRAIRTVRARAAELGVQGDRIGVWGFSAGGHLASSAATLFDEGNGAAADPVERVSARPDFAILVYPVITFTKEPYVHKGSRTNLLGENPDASLVEKLSTELQVTARTPPTFLMHTSADTGVPAENSIFFYLALRKAGVPAEMHIYEQGPHGFGLGWADLSLSSWPARLADWLRVRGLL